MAPKITLLALCAIITSNTLQARDIYVLRFASGGPFLNACTQLVWGDRLLFHNAAELPLTITLLDTTYPVSETADRQVTIEAGEVRSVDDLTTKWDPAFGNVGVAHFDVPDGVNVLSRTGAISVFCTGSCLCPLSAGGEGSVPQRVYEKLVPANTPQIHVATDLETVPSRTNVAVYNAGANTASVTVELRQACNDALLVSRQLTVPPRSVIMSSGITADREPCPDTRVETYLSNYIQVVSSEPSLSWVTTIANDVAVPRVNLAAD